MLTLGVNLPKPQPGKIAKIKEWITDCLKLDGTATIFVTQLECREPDCPPVETVIAIIKSQQKTLQKKTHRSINEINRDDVYSLFT